MKNLRPLLFFVSMLLIVGLACSFGANSNPPTQAVQPTQPPPPTAVSPTEAAPEPTVPAPTEPPVQQSQQFFTEEFDQDPGSDWVTNILGPGADTHKDSVETSFDNGRFRIELPEKDLYFYYDFTGFTYENVRVDLRADNRGVNTNNVSLTCRSSADGWYEWSVGSGGDWYLYAVTDKYNLLTNGGTNFLKQGKEVNEYTLICKDKAISMFINGQEIKQSPVTDNNYGLREGSVGFNISSLSIVPVIVEVEWFKISEP
ncbi:MAG TPA: hypothetical protein VN843_29395 [Anaerolineales bacterium]|nr:hypothetical protein [Anaerolineales bacterium]